MVAQRVFAEISMEVIRNVMVCEEYELANRLARATYGNDAFAVEITDVPARIGDKYQNGYFYRVNDEGGETRILPIPSTEIQLEELRAQMLYLGMKAGVNMYE